MPLETKNSKTKYKTFLTIKILKSENYSYRNSCVSRTPRGRHRPLACTNDGIQFGHPYCQARTDRLLCPSSTRWPVSGQLRAERTTNVASAGCEPQNKRAFESKVINLRLRLSCDPRCNPNSATFAYSSLHFSEFANNYWAAYQQVVSSWKKLLSCPITGHRAVGLHVGGCRTRCELQVHRGSIAQ